MHLAESLLTLIDIKHLLAVLEDLQPLFDGVPGLLVVVNELLSCFLVVVNRAGLVKGRLLLGPSSEVFVNTA